MFTSHRHLLSAALVMGLAAAQVHAQYPFRPAIRTGSGVNLNPQIAPGLSLQQAAYNTAVLGRAYSQVPPYALGYNPYPQNVYAPGPALVGSPVMPSPYALSTTPSYNPYLGTGSMGNSPYSLSTSGVGGGNSFSPYFGPPMFGWQDPLGAQLQGYASMISATGQYYKDIQQARITREQSRQMSYDTTRRRIELERWYEDTRLKPQQLREREMAAELESARKDTPETDISSGKALNTLLRSIQRTPQLSLGPNVGLEEENLKNINLTSAGSAGNVGLLKDATKLPWPEALLESSFDLPRKRLNQSLVQAVTILKDGDPVPESILKNVRADFKTINDKLNEGADELSPAQYIEARRFLNQLSQAVRALGDPNVGRFFNKTWTARGKNVAELVSHLSKEGLTFAPATPGDQAAYKALYLAMRQFEAGLSAAQAQK